MSEEPGKLSSTFRFRSVLKMSLGLVLAAVAFWFLAGRTSELSGASVKLAGSDWRWAIVALLAEALSFASYAYLQQRLLETTGIRVRLQPLLALTMATTAIAYSLPGEPAFSSAYRFQQYRRQGADAAGSAWVAVALLVASAIGLSLLLLAAVLAASFSTTGYGLRGALALSVVIILLAGAILVRRDLLTSLALRTVRAAGRMSTNRFSETFARAESSIYQLAGVEISGISWVVTVAAALATWILDGLCLLASFRIVAAPIPWEVIPLAYGVSQIAAVIPVIPGGLGLVEGSITAVLVAYGSSRIPTLATVLAYRIISFWLAIPAGWIAFAAISYQWRKSRRQVPDITGVVGHEK